MKSGLIVYTPAPNLGYVAIPQDNFLWMPKCSLGSTECETKLSSILVWAMFPWQHIADLRMGVCLKITHISAVTHPRLLNLKPN